MQRNRTALILAAAAALTFSAPADAAPWVFVLAGQSNMAGRGLPLPAESPDPRIMEFTHGEDLVTAREPLNGEQGVGPGIPFARGIVERYPDQQVILVQCAQGSTWMKEWLRGRWLFTRCAELAWRASRRYGQLRGVLFAQGESDAQNRQAAVEWAARYRAFVLDFREAVGVPRLPFAHAILGRTTEPDRFTEWGLVQSQQRAVEVLKDARVETSDLPLQDNVHFTVDGYNTLGERFARVWTAQHAAASPPGARLTRQQARAGATRFMTKVAWSYDQAMSGERFHVRAARRCEQLTRVAVRCPVSLTLVSTPTTLRGWIRVRRTQQGLLGYLLPWDPYEISRTLGKVADA